MSDADDSNRTSDESEQSEDASPSMFSLVLRSIVLAGVIGTASWWFVGYALAQVTGVLNPILGAL